MGERRERRKRETRQRISDVATKLFFERGFDAVTLDDVAAAAKVAKMTVFNYFPRKEDLMLDRQDDLKLVFFREAIRARPKVETPLAALRSLVKTMRDEKHPFARFDRHTAAFWRFVAASPSLEARLRELAEEAAAGLAVEVGGSSEPDGLAQLAAGMIVLSVRTARQEAVRVFSRGGSAKKARAAFFALLEHGLAAVQHMVEKERPAAHTSKHSPNARGRPATSTNVSPRSTH